MMQGLLGQPEGGWPPRFQEIVLGSAGVTPIEGRPGAAMPAADVPASRKALTQKIEWEPREEDVLSYLLYPAVYLEYAEHRQKYGDTSVVPTRVFFYGLQAGEETAVEIEPGKTLIIRYLTTGDVRDDGTRTVFFELNGQPREVTVTDRSAKATVQRRPKAKPGNPDHVAAPMPGKVSELVVSVGQAVRAGERLLSLEAMKMETAVSSPRDGTVKEIHVSVGHVVDAHDLLVELGAP
jgi:pyruvate carboxylase